MSILGAAGIAAGASLLGQGLNAYQTGRMNRRSERFAWNMYSQQRQDAMSDWNMQNAYNDPAAQMRRLEAAGLNPNLVYGNGSAANTSTAPRGSNAPTPKFEAPQMDFGSVAQQAMVTRQLQANIARTEADTERIQAATVTSQFRNDLNQLIGLGDMAARYSMASDKLHYESSKVMHEYNAWVAANFAGKPTTDPTSPLAKAYSAGLDQALEAFRRAKLTNDAVAADNVVREFKANLVKQGLGPDTPWYFKLLGDLLIKSGVQLTPDGNQDFFQFQ